MHPSLRTLPFSGRHFLSAAFAALAAAGAASLAQAQNVEFGKPYQDSPSATFNGADSVGPNGEHVTAKGRRAPPKGYVAAPTPDFDYGPDPDHHVTRDKSTGTDLQRFGSAYANSSPVERGSLGDATGNGWTAPRGNGW